ncbi:hypothetical protein LCGC14_0392330 [marine sediment metagenome]|uniref:Uncharacterized protein n=1 Tax=marine sediment metagenome TaxID=412755 RepID=A0A0F9T568_9ZZZZ
MPSVPTTLTIDHEEITGSPQETIDEEGRRVVRRLKCAWDDRYAFFRELLGLTSITDGDTGEQLIVNPDTFDQDDGIVTPLFARSIGIAPFDDKTQDADGSGRVAAYAFALMTVEYRTGRFGDDTGGAGTEESPDIVIEESLEPEAENISVERKDLVWESGSREANPGTKRAIIDPIGVPSKLEISLGWIVTYFNVLDPIRDSFFDHLGKINIADIRSQKFGRNWIKNTLLYSSFNAFRTFTTEGAQSWKLTCRFSRRTRVSARDSAIGGGPAPLGELGWNGVWRQEVSDYDALSITQSLSDVAGERVNIYQEADFTQLLLRQGT